MAVKQPPVGARYGLRDWLAQRATAALMILAFAILAGALVICRPSGFAEWREFVGTGWVRLLLFVSAFLVAWHGFIGVRDIVMDYVKPDWFRLMKHIGAAVYFAVCVAWAAMILF